MTRKWFTSDLHFKHKNIVSFSKRGVDTTAEEHDAWMQQLWNETVAPGDLVYHLGDFCFNAKHKVVADILEKLNGQKIMIKGNHCKDDTYHSLLKDGLIVSYQDYKEVKIGATKVCLFHYPISSWNGQGRGSWHLHGHSHGNFQDTKGKMLDVGVDNYYNMYGIHGFFTEDQIAMHMGNQAIYVGDHHKIIEE